MKSFSNMHSTLQSSRVLTAPKIWEMLERVGVSRCQGAYDLVKGFAVITFHKSQGALPGWRAKAANYLLTHLLSPWNRQFYW